MFGGFLFHTMERILHGLFHRMSIVFAFFQQSPHVAAMRHLVCQACQQHAPYETTDTYLHNCVIGFIPTRILTANKLSFNLFD